MISTAYRRLFVPVVLVGALALAAADLLLLVRPHPVPYRGAATALGTAGLLLAVGLLAGRRRSDSTPALVAVVAGLVVTAAAWGAVRSTAPGALFLLAVAALLVVAVAATLVRADAPAAAGEAPVG